LRSVVSPGTIPARPSLLSTKLPLKAVMNVTKNRI
jgi:hypothetical protein